MNPIGRKVLTAAIVAAPIIGAGYQVGHDCSIKKIVEGGKVESGLQMRYKDNLLLIKDDSKTYNFLRRHFSIPTRRSVWGYPGKGEIKKLEQMTAEEYGKDLGRKLAVAKQKSPFSVQDSISDLVYNMDNYLFERVPAKRGEFQQNFNESYTAAKDSIRNNIKNNSFWNKALKFLKTHK